MDKFKNDIQHKFSQREIQPTDEAWGKITGELATSRTSKTKSLWLWSGIAAGIIGLLVLLSPMYLSKENTLPVVNSEEKETQDRIVDLQKVESINRLQSNGISKSDVKLAKPQLGFKTQNFSIEVKPEPTYPKANTLLAEVEQELEAERFSQQNMNEVDALLAQARAKLSSKKDQQIFDKLTAESLLAEVDLENPDTFRDKIWKLIEVNFNELKSSLGSR